MSLVVELFGGPGIGKTTFAAKLFAALKDDKTYTVELVQEYVKTWAWEGREIGLPEQIYLTAKQLRNESRLYGKVDVIITDAPVLLGAYYARRYLNPILAGHLAGLYGEVQFDHDGGYSGAPSRRLRLFLDRVKPYNPRERFEKNIHEAQNVDYEMRDWLERHGTPFIDVPASTESTVQMILQKAKDLSGKSRES